MVHRPRLEDFWYVIRALDLSQQTGLSSAKSKKKGRDRICPGAAAVAPGKKLAEANKRSSVFFYCWWLLFLPP